MLKDKRYLFGLGTGLIIAAILLELMHFAEAGTGGALLPPSVSDEERTYSVDERTYSADELRRIAGNMGYDIYEKSIKLYTQAELDEQLALQAESAGEQSVAPPDDSELGEIVENTNTMSFSITIKQGMRSFEVSELLVKAGLIDDAKAFTEVVNLRGLTNRIRVGTFVFTERPDTDALIEAITFSP